MKLCAIARLEEKFRIYQILGNNGHLATVQLLDHNRKPIDHVIGTYPESEIRIYPDRFTKHPIFIKVNSITMHEFTNLVQEIEKVYEISYRFSKSKEFLFSYFHYYLEMDPKIEFYLKFHCIQSRGRMENRLKICTSQSQEYKDCGGTVISLNKFLEWLWK